MQTADSKRNFVHAVAGGLSGLSASLLVNPLDVIKIRVQNSSSKNSIECFYDILLKEGHKGFFRGISVTAVAYSVDKAIWFSVYVGLKDLMSNFFDLPEKSFSNQFYSSVLSSAVAIACTNPIWMIRTRFMTQPVVASIDTYHYQSISHAIRTIWSNEGIRAFYKGMGASFLGISHVAIQFPLYEQFKLKLRDKYSQDLKSSSILLASSLSKMIASVITYPHEVVRTRMQTQIGNSRTAIYKTLIQSFSLIYKREGISSFYKGLGINLLRTVPTTSISLLAYEIIAFKLEKYI